MEVTKMTDYIMNYQLTDFVVESIDIKDVNEKTKIQISFDKVIKEELK
jgi:hypothetical protein